MYQQTGNLEEMDTFLKIYNLIRLNHEVLENQNRPIICEETESVIQKLLTNETPRPKSFTYEFHQTFKDLMSIHFKLFQKTEGKKNPNLLYETSVNSSHTNTPPKKKKKKLQANNFGESRCKNLQ